MTLREKKFFKKYRKPVMEIPNLVEHQTKSYKDFIESDLKRIFEEFSPVEDYTGKKFELIFKSFSVAYPEITEYEAKEQRASYEAKVKVVYELYNKTTQERKQQEIFFFDIPVMTDHGTFIVNAVERVIVPQLSRSFGVFFTADDTKNKKNFGAKIIPSRGSWIEIETDSEYQMTISVDRKRRLPISSFVRIMLETDDDKAIMKKFSPQAQEFLEATLKKDPALSLEESYIELYKRLRDGELVAPARAEEYIKSIFSAERYDLSEIGRVKFNERFELKKIKNYSAKDQVITVEDIIIIINKVAELNFEKDAKVDDIDHLGSRRLRFFNEMIEQRFRLGMIQMKRNIQNTMSIKESLETDPSVFINPRPIQAKIKEFFNTNQLSQFMDQDNIVSELENLRTVSALGTGGLVRERAGFQVRDVHPSHYGKLCPIQTPEGQNIGLILRLATYAKVNRFGIIETPYRVVKKGVITDEVRYVDAYEEEEACIVHSAVDFDEKNKIVLENIEVRKGGEPTIVSREEVNFMDVSPYQPFSIATSMIPFVNHDEANRALMGSNMQRQAVPCIIPDAPIVATGIESDAARFTGRLLYAENDGEIVYADGKRIEIKYKGVSKPIVHTLASYSRTNSFGVDHQRTVVVTGQKVKKGDLLCDASSSDNGQAAVGQNMLVAFMSYYGYNYEDAIVISEKVLKDKKFTSVYINQYTIDVHDTKLGPEQTTHDIPNVSELKIRNLDEDGIVRIGTEVDKGDILVGKITPKGEAQLTPEERLLKSIFGDKARDVKDTSLKYKSSERGRVVSVKTFERSKGEINESGIIKRIFIQVASLRNLKVGDKLSGRHGNKGVVSIVLPEEDMPYMEDGTPIDIILTPLGVPSRMNLGQILEVHLGMAANTLNYQSIVPPFVGPSDEEIKDELEKAGHDRSGTFKLIDGRTGEYFKRNITVGYMYILKLHHMVQDKMHARSVGPYSLISQQPLGGKAQDGGQRFGEMEVWALLGHGASYTLREVLTVKSDDIIGRSAMYDSIIKGKDFIYPNTPESFNVMLNTLRGLSLNIQFGKNGQGVKTEEEIIHEKEDIELNQKDSLESEKKTLSETIDEVMENNDLEKE